MKDIPKEKLKKRILNLLNCSYPTRQMRVTRKNIEYLFNKFLKNINLAGMKETDSLGDSPVSINHTVKVFFFS